ncbi:MAG: ABC transporter ATP-binding protein [Acidobacteriota bacterium]|nr:ABC transporter ATP-binding protein [Acidobacteriota bacterium]
MSHAYTNAGRQVEAVRDINLEILDGEIVCIVGPSGCGKSSLLNLIAGFERPRQGEILVHGHPVRSPGPDRVVVFQDLGLFPWLTARGNVEFGLKVRGVLKKDRREVAERFMQMVHLDKFMDSLVHELSGGMKQRVALARSLALNPDILLMDEPFTALDAQMRDYLHLELQEIWDKTRKTILFVTHNVREAATLGHRVIVMTAHPGRIKKEFKVDLPRPRHIEDPGLIEIARSIMEELRGEVATAMKEELKNE